MDRFSLRFEWRFGASRLAIALAFGLLSQADMARAQAVLPAVST